jgi:hypothetical protein
MRIQIQRTRCLDESRRHRVPRANRGDPFLRGRPNMELDKAFEFAVILAWEDLMRVSEPRLVRVEYRAEPGTPLDYVSVWSSKGEGYLYLVCDYWTWSSSAHPSGVRFSNGHHSDQLAQALDFIMMNQDQFTRRATACRDGLVLISEPTADELGEAASRMSGMAGAATNSGSVADERALPMPSTAICIPGSNLSASAVAST